MKKTTYKTAKTIKEYRTTFHGYDLTIPAGSFVSNQTACGPDDNYRFLQNTTVAESVTGFKTSGLEHDLEHYGLNIPAEFCEPYDAPKEKHAGYQTPYVEKTPAEQAADAEAIRRAPLSFIDLIDDTGRGSSLALNGRDSAPGMLRVVGGLPHNLQFRPRDNTARVALINWLNSDAVRKAVGAPTPTPADSTPTPAALRAAFAIMENPNLDAEPMVSGRSVAEIIDKQTNLPELLAILERLLNSAVWAKQVIGDISEASHFSQCIVEARAALANASK